MKHNIIPTLRFHTFNHCAAKAKFQHGTGLNMLISVPHNKESQRATRNRNFTCFAAQKLHVTVACCSAMYWHGHKGLCYSGPMDLLIALRAKRYALRA